MTQYVLIVFILQWKSQPSILFLSKSIHSSLFLKWICWQFALEWRLGLNHKTSLSIKIIFVLNQIGSRSCRGKVFSSFLTGMKVPLLLILDCPWHICTYAVVKVTSRFQSNNCSDGSRGRSWSWTTWYNCSRLKGEIDLVFISVETYLGPKSILWNSSIICSENLNRTTFIKYYRLTMVVELTLNHVSHLWISK